jgi:PAS domain-containing protein
MKNDDLLRLWSFERLFNTLEESVWSMDFPVTRYLYFNDATTILYEVSREELAAQPHTWSERIHPDDKRMVEELYPQLFENGQIICEYRIVLPLGDIKWVRDKVILIKDEKDHPVRIEGITSDITEKVKTGRARILDQINLKAIIENTNDLIWSIDQDMKLVIANRPLYAYVEKIYNKNLRPGDTALFHEFGDNRKNEWEVRYRKALSGESFEMTMQGGEEKNYHISFNPIFDEDQKIIGVGCFAHDMTQLRFDEKRIKDQNEKLLNIARLSSHDLRKPVASILGLVELFDKKGVDKDLNADTIELLEIVTKELDSVIRKIVELTYEIDDNDVKM